jgi:outer membrane receptor protein involved in Fe transport
MSKFAKLFFVFALVLGMSAIVFGQSNVTGAIGGTVTNPNNEVVPGAAVSVVNIDTNKEETGTTDDEGRFRIVNLQPGNYKVTVNGPGFSPFTQDRVVVEVGRVTSLDVPLSIGPLSGSVEVTGEAPVINTTQQDFSTNINQTSINELPINGRRWSNFALLTPGAVPDGLFGLVSFRGISGLLNNSTIDGGDNNQAFFSEERGRTRLQYSISQAAVREFQVNTSNYSAEYGRAAGGVVNAITKSGTNDFHGDAFLYIRDEQFNARNPQSFQTLANGTVIAPFPEDNRKQFGGTIGGPIAKDRLFFFFSYDQQKRNFPAVAIPQNSTFFSTVNRTTLLARGLTGAQIDSAVAFLQSLQGEVPRRGDQTLYLPKIDWRINDNHTLTGTYNRLRWNSPNGIQTSSTTTRGRNSIGDDAVDVDWVTLRLASTISPTFLNEARFQWGKDFERQIYRGPFTGEPTTAPGGASPSIAITGGQTFGKPTFLNRTAFPDERRWQYADTVTMTNGNHTIKFGGDLNHVSDLDDNLFTEAGSYSYSTGSVPVNDFIVDYVNFTTNGAIRALVPTVGSPNLGVCAASTRRAGQCYTGTFNQGFGPSAFTIKTDDLNYFVQDDWRYTSRLTVNLGLRYEYQRLPRPQIPNLVFDGEPVTRFKGDKTGFFPRDKNNFGPRFGFAWDMSGDGKNSLRGGYGIYYGRIQNSTIANAVINTGNSLGQLQLSLNPIFPTAFASAAAAAGGTSAAPNIVVMSPTLRNPMIHQMDLVYERLLGRNTAFSFSFLSSHGRELARFVDINILPATFNTTYSIVGGPYGGQKLTVPRFTQRISSSYTSVTEIRSDVRSQYYAGVLQLNRRLTNGIQFQSSYTYSHANDASQQTGTFTNNNDPYDPFSYGDEEGPANFDVHHRFVFSGIWQPKSPVDSAAGRAILGGWSLAPVYVIQSGFPYSYQVTGNAPNNIVGGPPNIISAGSSITGARGANRLPKSLAGAGRNALRYPKFWNLDLRLSRRIKFSETMNLEFIAEGFNIVNRTPILGNLDQDAYAISLVQNVPTLTFRPTFQTPVPPPGETLYKARQFQFAVRFQF